MSKTAVQNRPITVPVGGGCDVLWGGVLGLPKPSYVPAPPRGFGGRAPMAGFRGVTPGKMEIEIRFGAFCRIFVSKRQLSSVSLFVNKN